MAERAPRRAATVLVAVLVTLVTLVALVAACGRQATDRRDAAFPSKPIRLLVPYAAGGPTDLASRAYGEFLARDLGQPVVVENKPGGSGALSALAVTAAARSSAIPDTPTTAQAGYPRMLSESWYGLIAPAGTPPACRPARSARTSFPTEHADSRLRWWSAYRGSTASAPRTSPRVR